MNSCDTTKEYEKVRSAVEYLNENFQPPGIGFQLELANEKNNIDIWVGILWRNIQIPFNLDDNRVEVASYKELHQAIKDAQAIRSRRGNGRPVVMVCVKTDPIPLDYAFEDTPERVKELEERINEDNSVIRIKFREKHTMRDDMGSRFEFLLLAQIHRVITRFLREDQGQTNYS